jgi:hypothetical protein
LLLYGLVIIAVTGVSADKGIGISQLIAALRLALIWQGS